MTTQELKQQIDKVLGNSIRCLLPSYWWKRLFNQVADRIEDVEQSTSQLIDSKVEEVKMPIVESVDELEKLTLAKGSVAAVEKTGDSATVKISDCYFSSNYEEDWSKYTIVKGVEEKDVIIDKDVAASVVFSASKETIDKDALQVSVVSGIFYYIKRADGEARVTSLEYVNKALSSGKYRAIFGFNDPDDCFIDDYFTFYSEKPQPSLYIKGDSWERLAKESDANITIDSELSKTSKNAVQNKVIAEEFDKQQCVFVVSSDGTAPENYKQQNKESYNKVYESIDANRWMNVFVLYSAYFRIQVDSITVSGYGELILYATFNDSFIEFRVSSDGSVVTQYSGSLKIDSSISTTSTNPVQNKVITAALNEKASIAYVDEKVANAGGEGTEYPLLAIDTNKDGTWQYAENNEVENIFEYGPISVRLSIDGGTPSVVTTSFKNIDGVRWFAIHYQADGFFLNAEAMGITKVTYLFSPSFTYQGFIESTEFQFDYETGGTSLVTIKMDMLKGLTEEGVKGALISSAEFPKIEEFNELKESVNEKADKAYIDEKVANAITTTLNTAV